MTLTKKSKRSKKSLNNQVKAVVVAEVEDLIIESS